MNIIRIFLSSVIIWAFASAASASVDIVVVLDQSGSISNNLPVVLEYVKQSIFGKVAKADDNVYLFTFDGKFYHDATLPGNASVEEIDSVLGKINPVGWYTDLTNAVESMRTFIQDNCDPDRRKVVFFLTDGLNDPPAFSPYRAGLEHRFFAEAKKDILDGGWEVFITGIGEKTDAGAVADMVGADYVELSPSPTLSEFDEKLTSRLKKARSGKGFWFWFAIAAAAASVSGGGYYVYSRRL